MKTVVLHHTCGQEGGEEYVLANAPFYAKDFAQERKYQFLGAGYYFWDDDIEQAHYWGKVHYNNNYYIIVFDCNIDEEFLLDLNTREGQKTFFEMQKALQEVISITNKSVNVEDWALSKVLKLIYNSGINFAYKVIKVKDEIASKKRQQKVLFTSSKENFTYLGGVYFYFFRKKEDIDIISKRIQL